MSVTPRLIPDTECAQGKCACTTTGCWDECAMKRVQVGIVPGTIVGTGAGIYTFVSPDTRIAELETALRAAQATIGGLEMEVARLTVALQATQPAGVKLMHSHASIIVTNICAHAKAGHTMTGWLDDACTSAEILRSRLATKTGSPA